MENLDEKQNNAPAEKLNKLIEFFCGKATEGFFSLDAFRKKLFYTSLIKSNEFKSFIIPQNFIPYYIILDIDLLYQVELWLKEVSPVSDASVDLYFKVKDYFVKWLFAEKEVEIVRYSKAIKTLSEQNKEERNFPLSIIFELFYMYEGLNKTEIPQLIRFSKRTIENTSIDEKLKNKLLYLLTLLSGVFYFREGDYSTSISRFSDALEFNPHSVTSKYFAALAYIKTGNKHDAITIITEIILYDLERLKHFVDVNSPELFNYFLNSPETIYILKDNNFAVIADEINEAISILLQNKHVTSSLILKKISDLKKLDLEDVYSEGIMDSISFIETIIAKYPDNSTFLFQAALFFLHEKLLKIIRSISLLIRNNYGKLLERKIERIEGEINNIGKEIDLLNTKIETEKTRTKENIQKALDDLDIYTKGIIEYNKGKLEEIQKNGKDAPKSIFIKSMRAGAIISVTAVIISLVAFLSSGNLPDGSSSAINNSFRLGLLSFIITVLFSFLAMIFSTFTRNKEKKKLLNKIKQQHSVKISESEKLKKRELDDLNRKVSKFVNEIDALKDKIEFLKSEKNRIETEYKNDYEDNIRKYQEKLVRIMNYE